MKAELGSIAQLYTPLNNDEMRAASPSIIYASFLLLPVLWSRQCVSNTIIPISFAEISTCYSYINALYKWVDFVMLRNSSRLERGVIFNMMSLFRINKYTSNQHLQFCKVDFIYIILWLVSSPEEEGSTNEHQSICKIKVQHMKNESKNSVAFSRRK